MAFVGVSEAARLAGIARSNFYKNYIQKGKISVTQNHQGKPQVDTAEIIRVFGGLKGDVSESVTAGQKVTQEKTSDNNSLEREVQSLREQLKDAKERESWMRTQMEALTEAVKLIENKEPQRRRRWWPFG